MDDVRDTTQRPAGHVGPMPLCKKVNAPLGKMCQDYLGSERSCRAALPRGPTSRSCCGIALWNICWQSLQRGAQESHGLVASGAKEFQGWKERECGGGEVGGSWGSTFFLLFIQLHVVLIEERLQDEHHISTKVKILLTEHLVCFIIPLIV